MSLESAQGRRAHKTPASRDTLASLGTLVTMDCLGEMDETGQRATRGTQVPTTCVCSCPPLLPTSSLLLHSFITWVLSAYPLTPLHPSTYISLHRLEDTDRQPAPARPRLGVGYRAAQAIRTLSSWASHWVGLPASISGTAGLFSGASDVMDLFASGGRYEGSLAPGLGEF